MSQSLESQLGRREFLLGTAWIGASLVFGCRSTRGRLAGTSSAPLQSVNPWLSVSTDGVVQVFVDKIEMGQGISSLMVGMASDALGVSPEQIVALPAPVNDAFANRSIIVTAYKINIPIPAQLTAQSTSTLDIWSNYRVALMTARASFRSAAAQRWGVSPQNVVLRNGFAEDGRNGERRTSLAELLGDVSRIDVKKLSLEPLPEKTSSQMRRIDLSAKVLGEYSYGLDIDASTMGVPKLRYAVVVRSPEIGATMKASNIASVAAMPGVFAVLPILKGRGIAVVADRYWQAQKAARELQIQTIPGPNRSLNSETLVSDYLAVLRRQKKGIRTPLDLGAGKFESINLSSDNVSAEYIVPYLPHSTLEPMNASVAYVNGAWSVWAPTQFPEAAQAAASRVFGVKPSEVRLQVTGMGGGFGRRLANDYIAEVAAVAFELGKAKGLGESAVKLLWNRADDFQYDYYRPLTCHSVAASLDANGIDVWKQEIATQSIIAFATQDFLAALVPDKIKNKALIGATAKISKKLLEVIDFDPYAVEGALDTDYSFGRFIVNAVGLTPDQVPQIPVGYWRSVGHTHTCFAIESLIDELAAKYGRSEVELRRKALRDSPRGLASFERLLSLSSYSGVKGGTSAMGLARHAGWGSFIAMAVQVTRVGQDDFKVSKIFAVVDCGHIVQADNVRQQIEGGIIFGLSAALKQEIHVEQGQVRERNFYDSGDIMRINEIPEIVIELTNQPVDVVPGGCGELGVPCVAPAIANAVHKLTGKRVRRLPLTAARLQQTLLMLLFLLGFSGFWLGSAQAAVTFAGGPEALDYMLQVVKHPRCSNCHGIYNEQLRRHVPLVGEQSQVHPMNIDANFARYGGDCTSCHGRSNPKEERLPPGAAAAGSKESAWKMPPQAQIFATLKTRQDLCRLWTDPNRNALVPGERGSLSDLPKLRKEFVHHIEEDALVKWSFAPGPGRSPAPGTQETLVQAMDAWIRWLETGKTCDNL